VPVLDGLRQRLARASASGSWQVAAALTVVAPRDSLPSETRELLHMLKRSLRLALMVSFSVPCVVRGQQANRSPLTLDQCVSIAIAQNPLVLASHEQHRAALARINQARALPQPVFSIDSDLQPRPFHFGRSGEKYFGLTETIELPGKRAARSGIATAEAGQVSTDADILRIDLTYEVTEAFNHLLLAQERLKYADEDRRLSQQFLSQTKLKHEAGDVAQVEVLRAALEASQAENAIRVAQNEVTVATARLNYLLARPEQAQLNISGELRQDRALADPSHLKERALSERAELRRLQFSVEREHMLARQASLTYLPDIELGLARHTLVGEQASWDVTVSLPVPLFFWQPKKGEIAEAQANIAAAERDLEHLRASIALEVEEAYRNVLTAREQIALFEGQILKQAQEAYEMFAFSYQEGEIGGLELIAARRSLLQARQSYAEALYNSNVAFAALDRAVGR
jgi:cobalt-zinc-cadmium efflux system outer membrane protein